MKKLQAIGLFVALSMSASVSAHHGTAGFYDKKKLVKIEGVVQEFQWRNPHAGIYILVTDAAGKQTNFSIEMPSPASLSKVGFTRRTFKPGDKVAFEIWPAFGSTTNGEMDWRKGVWVNGKQLDTSLLAGEEAP